MSDLRWAGMQLADHPNVWDALTRGLPVPRERLRADVLERIGEPISGPDFVLTEELVLRCEVSLNGAARAVEPFTGLTHEQVLALEFEHERQLIEDLVETGVVGVVAGVPETHKSWLAQAIAIAVARGEGEVLGCRVVNQGAVGYVWQDDSRRNEAERVQLYSRRHELPAELPVTWFLNVGLQLPDDLARLRATVEQHELVLVVMDSFYNVAVGADLKDRDAGQIFAALKSDVCDATGCTVLVVDHMPWANDQNRGRLRTYGDVFKGAALRFGIYVDAEKKKLWVEARGNNIKGFKRTPAYWDADALELRLVDTNAKEEDETELDASVLAWLTEHAGQHSTTAVREAIPKRGKAVDDALERLKARPGDSGVRDLGRDGRDWSGRPGAPRYWEATIHAASTSSHLFGTSSDEDARGVIAEPTSAHPSHPRRGDEVGADEVEECLAGQHAPATGQGYARGLAPSRDDDLDLRPPPLDGTGGNGRIPVSGDPDFPDWIDQKYHDRHIFKSEWLERRKLHALVLARDADEDIPLRHGSTAA